MKAMWQDFAIGGVASSSRSRAFATSLLVLVALAVLPAAASATPLPSSVARNVQVKPSGTTSVSVRCPSRQSVALAGAVVSAGSGAVPRDSVPGDGRSWTFRFTTLGGSSAGSRRARVVLRCVRLRIEQGMQEVRLRVFTGLREVTIRALSSRRVRVSCAPGFVPTGYGMDRAFRSEGGPLPAADLRLAASVPSTGSWVFRVENAGGSDTRAALRVRCLARTATARRGSRSLRQGLKVHTAAFSDSVGTGSSENVTHSCPAGHFSLATGHALSANDDIFVRLASPFASRSGRWTFDHQAGGSQSVRTYLTCLSLRTSFR